MKLFWSPRSPFVRKVLIVAHELQLADQIEKIPATVGSATLSEGVMTVSPLNRIPALFDIVGEADLTVIGSSAICKYLNEIARGKTCPERADWRRATREAVADGILEVNVLRLGDLMRAENLRSHQHLAAFAAKTAAALNWLEYRASEFSATHMGAAEAALASGLAHLDFRFPDDEWRKGRPGLTRWLQNISTRTSFIATEFQ